MILSIGKLSRPKMIVGFSIFALAALIFLGIFLQQRSAPAPPSQTPKTIGVLQYISFMEPSYNSFKDRMRELGYEEGKDVIYEYVLADSKIERVNEIARDFIAKDMDLIYAITSVSGRGALKETIDANRTDIPIVYAHADNPVSTGLAKSFRSSGNNATGVMVNMTEITTKKLEFLRQFNPEATKIGLLVAQHTDPAANFAIAELRKQAPAFGMAIIEYPVENPPGLASVEEIQALLGKIQPGEIDAIFHTPGPVVNFGDNIKVLVETGKRLKIITIMLLQSHVEAGGLFTYGHDLYAIGEQAAVIADKILKGAKPTDIPLEFPTRNRLIINAKTAREIGVIIPDSLREIADELIEK